MTEKEFMKRAGFTIGKYIDPYDREEGQEVSYRISITSVGMYTISDIDVRKAMRVPLMEVPGLLAVNCGNMFTDYFGPIGNELWVEHCLKPILRARLEL